MCTVNGQTGKVLLRRGLVAGALIAALSADAQSLLTNYQDGTQNIVFVGPDQHVYQIVANSSTWTSMDVTVATGLPLAATGSALASFANGAISISFFGVSGHLYQAVYANSSWAAWILLRPRGSNRLR